MNITDFENIKLYHYGSDKYQQLETLSYRGLSSEYDKEGNFINYSRSISFFLKPIPNNVASIFKNKSERWIKGTTLIEHVVYMKDIPKDVRYMFSSTKEELDLTFNKQDWASLDNSRKSDRIVEKYRRQMQELKEKLHYVGETTEELKLGMRNVEVDMEKDFQETARLTEEGVYTNGYKQYASGVAHIQISVGNIPVPVSQWRTVKIR